MKILVGIFFIIIIFFVGLLTISLMVAASNGDRLRENDEYKE